MNIGVFYVSIIVCGRISEFCCFAQYIRALPEAQAAMEPAWEIREGLEELLSHSNAGPKTTYKIRNCEKPVPHNFWTEYMLFIYIIVSVSLLIK